MRATFNRLWTESALFRVGVSAGAVVAGLLAFLPQPQPGPASSYSPLADSPWPLPGSGRPAGAASVPTTVVKGATEVITTGIRATGEVLGAVLVQSSRASPTTSSPAP